MAPTSRRRRLPPDWTVGDQLSHLWFFDQRALLALTEPEAFARDADAILAAVSGGGEDPSVGAGRALPPGQLLERWREDRRRLVDHARTVDPRARVPWYGPAMGARSFITARLMETWAHGQDVADALGVERTPTDRLRHVAHIGVGARAFSYLANGREPSQAPVRVELVAPSGDIVVVGARGCSRPGDRSGARLLPARDPAPAPRRRRSDRRGRGRRRVARHRPVVRRPTR